LKCFDPEGPAEDGLLDVQAVFGFVEYDRLRPVDHLLGNLVAPLGRQTMHEERPGRGVGKQSGVDLEGFQDAAALALVGVARRYPRRHWGQVDNAGRPPRSRRLTTIWC